MLSNALVLYPPGYPPNGSLTLPQVPSASGVHYRAADIDFRSNGRCRDVGDGARALRRLCCKPGGCGVARNAAPQHNASLTGERRKGMLKNTTVWGAALAAIVVAVLLVMRAGPDSAPDVVTVLEQAPLPLPTGPRETLNELQRQIRLPQEPAGDEDAPKPPPAVAPDEPELAAAPDGSRRFMFDCGNGVIFARPHTCPAKRRCLRRRFSAPAPSRCRRPKSLPAPATRPATRVFWSKGGVATFEVRGRSFVDCTSNPGAARSAEALRRACDVPRARPLAVVGARDLAAAAHVDDGARPAPHGVSVPRSDCRRCADDVSLLRRHARARRRHRPKPLQRHAERRAVRQHRRRDVRERDLLRLRPNVHRREESYSVTVGNACHFCADLLAATTVSMNAMPRSAALMPGTARGAGPPLALPPCARTCAAKLR